jgi:succinate-semialdehyde dehydrogenase / glutarate-semialdehyde dehydrogenase
MPGLLAKMRQSASTMVFMIATVNPATGETLRTFDPLSEEQIEDKIRRADCAFRSYRRTSLADRARWLQRAGEILDAERDRLGRIMTLEMGKPIIAARAEAAKCALACRYYVEHGERLLADETIDMGSGRGFVRYEPIGAVLAVMPWNFPFWQVFRFVAPALMAGNVGLLKHASNVPQCALEIENVIRSAGFPEDVFQTLLIGSKQVERVLDDPRVKAVTLTGSEPAGQQVASQAGRQIKKSVLELGGSDPFIVTAHADLDRAVATAVEARCINNGQSCIAAKRFIVDEQIAPEFERRFAAGMDNLRLGDPMEESTQLGPLSTEDMVNDLDEQVRRSVDMGARVVTGGNRLRRPGFFFAPTVLADVPVESPAYREELFGPVAVILVSHGVDDALRLANDTPFGLGASVWTHDEGEQRRFIDEIEAGMVFVNSMVASDPRLPFGGVKRSGYGRELSGYGMREFLNIKTVRVA